MNTYGNIITDYNDMVYKSHPVRFDEFMMDKYNRIHLELFNDALNKYFNDIASKYIDYNFIYEFFSIFANTNNNFDLFYEKLSNLDSSHIFNIIASELSIDKKDYFYELFNLLCEYLDSIKNNIIDKNLLTNILSISDIIDFRIVYNDNINYIYVEAENDNDEYEEYETFRFTYNSEENKYEITKENLFKSELNEYLIILENENIIKIGYNRFGEFIIFLNNDNPIFSFNSEEKQIYFDKYLNNKSLTLIDRFKIITETAYKNNHKIIEIKNEEYWMPSSIIIISNSYPYSQHKIDL